MTKVIQKTNVADLLKLLSDFEIFGPIQEDETFSYQNIQDGKMVFDFTNSQKPPKQVFFPQTEKMFDFKREGKAFTGVQAVEKSEKPILLLEYAPVIQVR